MLLGITSVLCARDFQSLLYFGLGNECKKGAFGCFSLSTQLAQGGRLLPSSLKAASEDTVVISFKACSAQFPICMRAGKPGSQPKLESYWKVSDLDCLCISEIRQGLCLCRQSLLVGCLSRYTLNISVYIAVFQRENKFASVYLLKRYLTFCQLGKKI